MAGCQKNPGSGWLGVEAGRGTGRELFKVCCRTGNFPVWRCQGCKRRHIYSPPEGREGGKEEEEVVFPLSATIASSELHERKNRAFRLH